MELKKRRRELKSSTNKQVSTSEVQEGATYTSAIDLAGNVESEHLQDIPDNAPSPVSSSLSSNNSSFLSSDLTTTGLENQVRQIS